MDQSVYSYLLGLYVGDGTISRHPREVWRLRIFQDQRYPDLIDACRDVMAAVLPNNVHVQQRTGSVEISAYSKHWPCLFPQVGPGLKHTRPIVLATWQQAIVDDHPRQLVRGLIHSDGCRSINTIRRNGTTYRYPRYYFSNASTDIMRIFTDTCDALDVHWTRLDARNVAVSRKRDVAFLDTFIGPKS